MAEHALKALYREYVDVVWNRKNLAAMDRYFTQDTVENDPPPGLEPGLAGLKALFGMFFAAFPDAQVTVEKQVAEGDTLVARLTFRGTQRGTFFGIPATNRHVTVSQTHILRYTDGKIAEHWGNSDDLSMMQQLGVIQMLGH